MRNPFLDMFEKHGHGKRHDHACEAPEWFTLQFVRLIMLEFDNLKANVAANTASIEALAARIAAIPAGAPGIDPAEVQAVADAVAANTAKVDALVPAT